jgi:hypothetical protein
MKFLPMMFGSLLLFALAPAYADQLVEVTSPPGDEPASQVLEIPQDCSTDATAALCNRADAEPADESTALENSAQTEFADDFASDDQIDRQQADTMVSSSGSMMAPPVVEEYVVPMPMVVRPVPVAPPVVVSRPFVPPFMAAPGPIFAARPGWGMMPAPPAWSTPPSIPTGMPHTFRTR